MRRPVRWAEQPWPTERIVRVLVTSATLIITTIVMMNVVHVRDLVFADTTPTGGDMGAHVWGPAFLRDHLLPNFQLSGWSMDWYAGMPVYRFYMVVPALAMVALDVVLPYGVAFKLVAIAGLVSLPICCWAFGRLARFRYPLPELFAIAGVCFALDESFSIYGADQIVRHSGGKRGAADQQRDVGGVLGQVESGLACGVGPADDEYVLTRNGWRHHSCRAVEDAGADKAIEFGNVEVAVGNAGSEDHCSSGHLAGVVEGEHMMIALSGQSCGSVGEDELGS